MALPAHRLGRWEITCQGWHRIMMDYGLEVISGVTQINGAAAKCKVILQDFAGANIGIKESNGSGVYDFYGLTPGDYRLIVNDMSVAWRSKVEHIVIP